MQLNVAVKQEATAETLFEREFPAPEGGERGFCSVNSFKKDGF